MDEKELRSVPLFEGLGKKERQALAQSADVIDIAEGKQLAREGEFAYEFFVIRTGTAEVTQGEKCLNELGPGDFFGEMGVLAAERRVATVTSTSPMELIVLTDSALRTLQKNEPGVCQRLRDAIQQRFSNDS